MSSMEYWNGEARKLELSEGVTWEQAIGVLEDAGWKIDRECSEEFRYIETTEWISHKSGKPFPTIINGDIYIIENYTCTMDEDPCGMDVWDNDNGTIGFSGSFYNGGTDLTEMLHNAIKDHKPVKTLWNRSYCGEDLGHVSNEIHDFMEDILEGVESDEHGFPLGKFNLTITWEE